MAWDKSVRLGRGARPQFPALQSRNTGGCCSAGATVVSTATGQAVGPGGRRGIRGAGRGEAHCRALRGGAASGRERRRPRRDPAPPRFPTACHSLGLPSPRVLGPSAPSSSPGLIGRTLTLAADGAQSSSTPGRKRHTNRADRCISNSERSTKGARWLPRFVTGQSPSRLGPGLTSTATVWPPPGSWAGHTATGHHGARAVFHF